MKATYVWIVYLVYFILCIEIEILVRRLVVQLYSMHVAQQTVEMNQSNVPSVNIKSTRQKD